MPVKMRKKELAKALVKQQMKELPEDHPLLLLLTGGSDLMPGQQVLKLTQIHLDLCGEAFWLLDRDATRTPRSLYPLVPTWVHRLPTRKRPFYLVEIDAVTREIPVTEIIRFTDPDPLNPFGRGTGLARTLADELQTDEFAAKLCHDPKTECLTERGWVPGLELTESDKIATWHPVLEKIEYHRPFGITRERFRGKLQYWEGDTIDAAVTPTHRLWVQSESTGDWCFAESQEIAKKKGRYYRWRDAGWYDGASKVVSIPAFHRLTKRWLGSRGGGRAPLRGVDDALTYEVHRFASFLGFYVSEGTLDGAGVIISQTEGKAVEAVRQALRVFPADWVYERSERSASGKRAYKWSVRHFGLAEWIRANVGNLQPYRRLPKEVFEWPAVAQRILLESLIDGDGTWHRGQKFTHATYASSSQGLLDDVQRLCVQLGYSSFLRPVQRKPGRENGIGRVSIRMNAVSRRLAANDGVEVKDRAYDGLVWCVTVPNELFFTRRNGCVMLGGNTKMRFVNSGRPDLIVSADDLNQDEVVRLEEGWLEKVGGFMKSFRPFFAARKLDVKVVSQTFAEMQMIELRKFERDSIIQTWGMPPEILGILTNSNRATIQSADFIFSAWVVEPRLEFIRRTLQFSLVPMFDERLMLDFESPIDEDRDFRLVVMKVAPKAFKLDEFRELAGLEPLPDKAGEELYEPGNQNLIGEQAPSTPPQGGGLPSSSSNAAALDEDSSPPFPRRIASR